MDRSPLDLVAARRPRDAAQLRRVAREILEADWPAGCAGEVLVIADALTAYAEYRETTEVAS